MELIDVIDDMERSWFRLYGAPGNGPRMKVTVVHKSLLSCTLADMAARQIPVDQEMEQVDRWAFDLGGSIVVGMPHVDVNLDGLVMHVWCHQVDGVLDALRRLTIRTFADGTKYYKLHHWHYCTVLSEEQMTTITEALEEMLPMALEEEDKFWEGRESARKLVGG
jgi:hypothetical protein